MNEWPLSVVSVAERVFGRGQRTPHNDSTATMPIINKWTVRNQKLRTQDQRSTIPTRIAAIPTTTNAT